MSFDRPELSPCLAKLDKSTQPYKDAIEIIQAGKDMLAKQPRGDTLDFVPCEKDRQRAEFYSQRVKVELANRQAIRDGKKLYEQKLTGETK